MLIVTGVIRVESVDEIARIKEALAARAARSRKDEGCIDYDFAVSLTNPVELRLIEKWESEDLLNAHLQIPDEEFNKIMATSKLEKAIVVANEVTSEKELLRR